MGFEVLNELLILHWCYMVTLICLRVFADWCPLMFCMQCRICADVLLCLFWEFANPDCWQHFSWEALHQCPSEIVFLSFFLLSLSGLCLKEFFAQPQEYSIPSPARTPIAHPLDWSSNSSSPKSVQLPSRYFRFVSGWGMIPKTSFLPSTVYVHGSFHQWNCVPTRLAASPFGHPSQPYWLFWICSSSRIPHCWQRFLRFFVFHITAMPFSWSFMASLAIICFLMTICPSIILSFLVASCCSVAIQKGPFLSSLPKSISRFQDLVEFSQVFMLFLDKGWLQNALFSPEALWHVFDI